MLVLDLLPPDPSFTLAFAALLHEVGKPAAKVLHHGRYATTTTNKWPPNSRSALPIAQTVQHRTRANHLAGRQSSYLGEARTLRESKLKRILAAPGIEELLDLHKADALASFGHSEEVDYCRSYLERQPSGAINPPR